MASETPPAAAAGGGETRQATGEPDNHRGDGAAADGSAPMAATEAATTTAAAAPAPAAAAGAGGGDPGAIEAALAEARRAAAAGGATVGEEEDFPKGMTMVERLRKEPPLEIETVKVGIENLEVIGKLVTYNKSVLKDDEQNPVGEMYPIFMSLPAVYLKPKNMPKVSPGNIFQVAKPRGTQEEVDSVRWYTEPTIPTAAPTDPDTQRGSNTQQGRGSTLKFAPTTATARVASNVMRDDVAHTPGAPTGNAVASESVPGRPQKAPSLMVLAVGIDLWNAIIPCHVVRGRDPAPTAKEGTSGYYPPAFGTVFTDP